MDQLRSGVLTYQRNKEVSDFNNGWDRKKGYAEASSVNDIIDSGKLPFLNVVSSKRKDTEKSEIISSVIITTFLQSELQSSVVFESDRAVFMTRAFETLKSAKVLPDPNVAYFQSATYFAELMMYERAVKYYSKATERIDAKIVEKRRTADDSEMLRRKLERMSKAKRDEFLANLTEMHMQRCAEELERQRLRVRAAHAMLFYVHLQMGHEHESHWHLRQALRESSESKAEYIECLMFAHETLKQYPRSDAVHDRLVSSTAGPLSEAHIEILFGLLSSDWNPTECHVWLGKRFAEKGDCSASRDYFERARMIPLNALKEDVVEKVAGSADRPLTLP